MKKSALFGVIVTAFSLVSCGSSNSIPHDIVIPGSLQAYTPPDYVTGTEELAAFVAINSYRTSMGLGAWQQNTYLDMAAQNHMAYSVANCHGSVTPFMDDLESACPSNPNLSSGATPSARAIAVGYSYLTNTVTATNVPTASVGELYATGSATTNGSGLDFINSMVNTIYHRSGLLTQATVQMGLARDTAGTITPATPTHWWISHGRLTGSQSVSSNYVGVYPLNNQLSVPLSMTPEYPSVYSNVPNFNFATSTSSPVSITLSSLVNISVASFTVTPATCATAPCTALPGKIWTMSNDPNLNTADYSAATTNLITAPNPVPTIPGNEAFWVGTAPFLPNTTYNVSVTGTTYLIPYAVTNPITQTWSFTTGS